jgi:hypothetical protein
MEYRFEKDFEGVLIKILMEVNKNAWWRKYDTGFKRIRRRIKK